MKWRQSDRTESDAAHSHRQNPFAATEILSARVKSLMRLAG